MNDSTATPEPDDIDPDTVPVEGGTLSQAGDDDEAGPNS